VDFEKKMVFMELLFLELEGSFLVVAVAKRVFSV
jgi:hypothetical protein